MGKSGSFPEENMENTEKMGNVSLLMPPLVQDSFWHISQKVFYPARFYIT